MKDAARLLLDGRISRREFVSRVARTGVAATAARDVARSLSGETATAAEAPGRIVTGLTGGELMAEFLLDWNVPYVFGLAGSEEVGFLDALVDRIKLQYVTGLHEGSVMAMADGYARASGQTAFVNVHSVAGTSFALGLIVNASKDRVPIVVTAGTQGTDVRGTNAFLEAVNLAEIPRDYTRWHWDVLNAETIPDVLRRAFLLAEVPPGGPTFVTFSKDLWEGRVERAEILPRSRTRVDLAVGPSPEAVSRAVDLLVNAQLPVIVAGRELNRFGGAGHLQEIAERLAAPVFADLFASHSPITFPTTHPLFGGFYAEDEAFPRTFDAFWSVGGTMFTIGAPSPQPLVPRGASVIHTSLDGTDVGRNYPVDVPMIASVERSTAAVLDELKGRTLSTSVIDDRRRRMTEYARGRRQKLADQATRVWDASPISVERLASELNRRMDPGAIVVTELISEEQLADAYFDLNQSGGGRLQLTTSGGCLGWGLGAAVGAKIAQPDRQVVALVGDGSFQFGVQALWTTVRYEVPVAIVIWNNNAYQANRKFLHQYGGRAAKTGRYPGCSIDAPEIDHVSICKGYGVEAERVDDPGRLGDALDRCFRNVAGGRPSVVDVRIARRYGGADSTWHDFFSVARGIPRQS